MQKAAEEAVKEVAALGGSGGIISIDKSGKTGFAWTKDKLGMIMVRQDLEVNQLFTGRLARND